VCCAGFQRLLDNAGERGLAVLVVANEFGMRFSLQSRGIDYEHEPEVSRRLKGINASFNLSRSTGMRRCPFCGRKVERMLRRAPDYFWRLSRDHLKFSDTPAGWTIRRNRYDDP
jgi:hypothetical protein